MKNNKISGLVTSLGLVVAVLMVVGCSWGGSSRSGGSNGTELDYNANVSCPKVVVREGFHLKREFSLNKERVMENLIYQTSISNWDRICSFDSEGIRMKIMISGRTTTGPSWNGKSVRFPVYFKINFADNTEYASGKWSVEATINEDSASQPWTIIDESILLPLNATSVRVLLFLQDSENGSEIGSH